MAGRPAVFCRFSGCNLLDVGEISTKLPPYELHLDVYLIAAIWSLLYAMAFVRLAPKLGRSSRPSRFELTNHICAGNVRKV